MEKSDVFTNKIILNQQQDNVNMGHLHNNNLFIAGIEQENIPNNYFYNYKTNSNNNKELKNIGISAQNLKLSLITNSSVQQENPFSIQKMLNQNIITPQFQPIKKNHRTLKLSDKQQMRNTASIFQQQDSPYNQNQFPMSKSLSNTIGNWQQLQKPLQKVKGFCSQRCSQEIIQRSFLQKRQQSLGHLLQISLNKQYPVNIQYKNCKQSKEENQQENQQQNQQNLIDQYQYESLSSCKKTPKSYNFSQQNQIPKLNQNSRQKIIKSQPLLHQVKIFSLTFQDNKQSQKEQQQLNKKNTEFQKESKQQIPPLQQQQQLQTNSGNIFSIKCQNNLPQKGFSPIMDFFSIQSDRSHIKIDQIPNKSGTPARTHHQNVIQESKNILFQRQAFVLKNKRMSQKNLQQYNYDIEDLYNTQGSFFHCKDKNSATVLKTE